MRHSGRTVVRLGVLLLTAALAGCGGAPLPDQGTVPAFTLTDQAGRPLASSELAQRVWITNFIFTHCPDICPALTQQMLRLQKTLAEGGAGDVRLISISVDPLRDTPDVLRTYAAQVGATWPFLTGERAAVATLLKDGFHVAWADDGPATMPITHSDRFVLVDRRQRIRGYYHGMDAAEVARLADDARRLQSDPDA